MFSVQFLMFNDLCKFLKANSTFILSDKGSNSLSPVKSVASSILARPAANASA